MGGNISKHRLPINLTVKIEQINKYASFLTSTFLQQLWNLNFKITWGFLISELLLRSSCTYTILISRCLKSQTPKDLIQVKLCIIPSPTVPLRNFIIVHVNRCKVSEWCSDTKIQMCFPSDVELLSLWSTVVEHCVSLWSTLRNHFSFSPCVSLCLSVRLREP